MIITLSNVQNNNLKNGNGIKVKINGEHQELFKRGKNLHWKSNSRGILQIVHNKDGTITYNCGDRAEKQNLGRILWPDQHEAVAAAEALPIGGRGSIYFPTGTGKTVIAEDIIQKLTVRKNGSITAVFAPRLMLLAQWARDIAKYLVKNAGIPIAIIPVHSGSVSKKAKRMLLEAHRTILEQGNKKGLGPPPVPDAKTQSVIIMENVQEALQRGYHVLILCTYHSSGSLKAAGIKCDLCIYDEAHYLVPRTNKSETKFRDALDVQSDRGLFFTATPINTDADDGLGMNNESIFGKVLISRTPKDMIEKGYIVSPLIHQVIVDKKALQALSEDETDQIGKKDYESKMWLNYRVLQKHRDVIKATSSKPDRIGAKLLIVVDGQETLIKCFETNAFTAIRNESPELGIFGLSTDFGIYIDGEHHRPLRKGGTVSGSKKDDFLDALQELEPSKDAMIFHHNMIGEGLDVSGITGVLFLRNCDIILFLQNEGRTCRLHPEDREAIFETKELSPKSPNHEGYIKPNCYVILPWCIEWNGSDFIHHFRNIVEGLRDHYDIDDITTNIITDFLNVEADDKPTEEAAEYIRARSQVALRTAITEYCHEVEASQSTKKEHAVKKSFGKLNLEEAYSFISMIAGKDKGLI